jgi:conjugative transfer signal peptidase TraF
MSVSPAARWRRCAVTAAGRNIANTVAMSATTLTPWMPGPQPTLNIPRHTRNVSPLSLRHRHTRSALLFVLVGLTALGGTTLIGSTPRLIWNASASAPLGLYALTLDQPQRGDFALVRPPPAVRELAAERGYLPTNVPMVKRIAAANGDRVCALGKAIFIDNRPVTARLVHDSRQRPLPTWSGCRRLGRDDVFLLMAQIPDSFDGRYFGITQRASIIGKLVPLWTD